MMRKYSCVRATKLWPLASFFEIKYMAAPNAFIIFTQNYPEWCKYEGRRRKFLQLLCQELALTNVKTGGTNCQGKQKPTLEAIRLFLAENGERIEASHRNAVGSSKLCQIYSRKEDRKSRIKCSNVAHLCVIHIGEK
ncbi:hypothetical protein HHI36_012792 [Cryptolaemus montrouzieri]|uniref:Uncharacterized protein n=1 Tax=Cryptolaemus montrouzieri TaxID=559131 RepID=A0ABD2NG39_9CUCU